MHMHVHMHMHILHIYICIYIHIYICISFRFTSKGLIGECGQRGGYLEMVGFSDATRAQFTKVVATSLTPACTHHGYAYYGCAYYGHAYSTYTHHQGGRHLPQLGNHRPVFRRHDGERSQGGRAIVRAIRAGEP